MIRIKRRSGHGSVRKDSGYMLLFLMLAVAVLMITMLSVVRDYKRGIQRDREVEMIHRGEQYERAIKRFYKKNNRYPVSLEQLESMNKVRYLRKRYKDPMSADGEWKIVHPTDFKMTGSLSQTTTGAAATNSNATTKEDAAQAALDAAGTSSAAGNQDGSAAAASGTSSGSDSGSGTGASASGNNSGSTTTGTAGTQSAFPTPSGANNAANGQVLGGGDIYGVVSKSKKPGFHIYGEKQKYSEWFFVYDPSQDLTAPGALGRLMVGPYNPKMFVGSANSGLNDKGTPTTGPGIGPAPGTNTQSGSSSGTVTTQPNQ